MKIAVISDSHYDKNAIKHIEPYIKDVDMILHCGDGAPDLEDIAERFHGPVYGVKGNCDISSDYPGERIIDIEGKKIFITHGHAYGVKNDYNRIFYKGKELGVDFILFGHSHVGMVLEKDGVVLMNPGSISISYGSTPKSLGYIEMNENGEILSYLKTF